MTISTAAVREGEAADEYTRSTAQASSSPPRAKGGRPQGFLPLHRKLLGGFIIHAQVGEFFAGGGEGLEKFRAGFRVSIGFGVTLHFLDGAKGEEACSLAAADVRRLRFLLRTAARRFESPYVGCYTDEGNTREFAFQILGVAGAAGGIMEQRIAVFVPDFSSAL